MLFQFRTDDGDYVVFDLQFQTVAYGPSETGAELTAAVVTDTQLSKHKLDDFFDIAGQIVDYHSRDQELNQPPKDWFKDEWLPSTRGGNSGSGKT